MNRWEVSPDGETAVGTPVPVIADGDVFAVVSPIWSNVDGVRVSIDWTREALSVQWVEAGAYVSVVEDMSASQAVELARVLRSVALLGRPR